MTENIGHDDSSWRWPPAARITLPGGWSGETMVPLTNGGGPFSERRPSTEEWKSWLHQMVTDCSSLPGYQLLKYSPTTVVCLALLPVPLEEDQIESKVICKRTESRGRLSGMLHWFRPSRAQRHWRWSLRLLDYGVATARPIAWIKRHHGRHASWVVCEYLPELIDLDRLVLTVLPSMDSRSLGPAKSKVIDAVAQFMADLKNAGLHHRDLKASNIMLRGWDAQTESLRCCIVDLDGLRRQFALGYRQRWQPLIRLAASLQPYKTVTRTDYYRFLKRWLRATRAGDGATKQQFRLLSRRAVHYARAAKVRGRHKLGGFAID